MYGVGRSLCCGEFKLFGNFFYVKRLPIGDTQFRNTVITLPAIEIPISSGG